MDVTEYQLIEYIALFLTALILMTFLLRFLVFFVFCVLVRWFYLYYKTASLRSEKIPTYGKTVVVTGCDSGFGHSLAVHLESCGFNVFATCLDFDSEGAQALFRMNSPKLTVLHLDVTSDSMVQEVLTRVKKSCGVTGLWGLVNNAGMNFVGDAELTTMEQYFLLSDINVYGMVRMCKAFLPLLRQAKGRIVNVTSVKGLISIPVSAPYTMTKYAAESFSEILRQEAASFGVKVVIIEPSNFGGATGCLNPEGMARIENQLKDQWKAASDEVKKLYGWDHLEGHMDGAMKAAISSDMDISKVIRVFDDALRLECPSRRYLVHGYHGEYYIDIYAWLARLTPFLPQKLNDYILSRTFPYHL